MGLSSSTCVIQQLEWHARGNHDLQVCLTVSCDRIGLLRASSLENGILSGASLDGRGNVKSITCLTSNAPDATDKSNYSEPPALSFDMML